MSVTQLSSVRRGRAAFVAVAVSAGLALTGCDSGRDGDSADAASTEPAESSLAPTNTYVVVAGDTLNGIAASHGLSLSELVEVNGWSDGSEHAIFPGDVIALPEGAVAVSTTRPADNGGDDDDDTTTMTAGSSATTTAPATGGGYAATSGPSLDGLILAVTEPLVDGTYLSNVPSVSGDGSTITFELLQCPEPYGTAPGRCLDLLDFVVATTASMRVDAGTASVLLVDGIPNRSRTDHRRGTGPTAGRGAARRRRARADSNSTRSTATS